VLQADDLRAPQGDPRQREGGTELVVLVQLGGRALLV
jgi:hypothetical protein